MFKGTIVENSLSNKSILKDIQVNKTWKDGSWILHSVQISEEKIPELSKIILPSWYMHFWKEGSDDIKVIFKDKIFTINHSDKNIWTEAIAYKKLVGILEEQLDFVIID